MMQSIYYTIIILSLIIHIICLFSGRFVFCFFMYSEFGFKIFAHTAGLKLNIDIMMQNSFSNNCAILKDDKKHKQNAKGQINGFQYIPLGLGIYLPHVAISLMHRTVRGKL
ncbi:hypothetical protein ACJX0J_014496, partial [Zea mays]